MAIIPTPKLTAQSLPREASVPSLSLYQERLLGRRLNMLTAQPLQGMVQEASEPLASCVRPDTDAVIASGTIMGILETQLKHIGYELDMLIYTFDKLLLVEQLVQRSFQAGQVNALIEAFCLHARNLDEFFQGSGRDDTLKAATYADSRYKPRPSDKERKTLITKINRQISHLTEQRTSVAEEKIGSADRAKLYSILIAEADNFTRHLQPHLRPAWKYVPGAAPSEQA